MPHQCTDCGRTFADGSKEMLSGCPDCGGNKFQFLPAGAVEDGPETGGSPDSQRTPGSPAGRSVGGTAPKKPPEDATRSPRSQANAGGASDAGAAAEPDAGDDGPSSAVDRAAATVRDWVGAGGSSDEGTDSPAGRGSARSDRAPDGPDSTRNAAPEDAAQASARSDVVTEAELPDDRPASTVDAAGGPKRGEVADAPGEASPGLKELREELNSQFESIRIVEPGQYELNLMELYEREEYIIALQEDGKYVIEVPDGWETPDR